mgnify:CR=1 FL=1|jgi:hypothetical protein
MSYLGGHIVGGGAVEVLIGPFEELFFLEDVLGLWVGNLELGN